MHPVRVHVPAVGDRPASPASGSMSRTPTSRASETWAIWSSSYQRRIRFTGSTSICAIRAPVVSSPTPIQPFRTNTPPSISTEQSTVTCVALMTGKSTDRSQRV